MMIDLLVLVGFLVVLLAMSLWTAKRLPPARSNDGHVSTRPGDNILLRWFELLLQPLNWLLLGGLVLLSEWSINAQSNTGTHVGQALGGLAVIVTHAALLFILLRWSRR